MDGYIVEKINEDLSLEELGEIAKTALATIYSKLRSDNGFGYTQHCFVLSLGRDADDIDIYIVDGTYLSRYGNAYGEIYHL